MNLRKKNNNNNIKKKYIMHKKKRKKRVDSFSFIRFVIHGKYFEFKF